MNRLYHARARNGGEFKRAHVSCATAVSTHHSASSLSLSPHPAAAADTAQPDRLSDTAACARPADSSSSFLSLFLFFQQNHEATRENKHKCTHTQTRGGRDHLSIMLRRGSNALAARNNYCTRARSLVRSLEGIPNCLFSSLLSHPPLRDETRLL